MIVDPGMPDLLVEYGDQMLQRPDGKVAVGNHIIADKETWEQLLNGVRCAWCLHPQSIAWPERCEFKGDWQGMERWCGQMGQEPHRGFIRDHQMEFLGQQMRGHADYSPPDPYQSLDDEKDYWKPTKFGLVIPRDIGA